jgi:probable rRNA maturation factor
MARHIAIHWDEQAATVNTPASVEPLVQRAVEAALRAEEITHAEISVTLLSDAGITDMNRQWLQQDRPTDVLAFPLYEEGEAPVGDIYIGIEQAVRQANEHNVPVEEEIVRLAIHGTLHVLGYDHDEGDARVKGAMWRAQERLVTEVMSS